MRVFMLGWEFPPFISGGLGTACYGLTRALSKKDAEVTFVLPKAVGTDYSSHVRMLSPQSPDAAESYGPYPTTATTPKPADAAKPTDLPAGTPPVVSDGSLPPAPSQRTRFNLPDAASQPDQQATGPTSEAAIRESANPSEPPRLLGRAPEAVASTYQMDPTQTPGLENVIFKAVPAKMLSPYQSTGQPDPTPWKPGQTQVGMPGDPTPGQTYDHEPISVLQGGPHGPQPVGPGGAPSGASVAANSHYQGDLIAESMRYADLCADLAEGVEFDVIHAHDWLTYPAGLAVAAATGKPLVVHVHSTEFDRAGERANKAIADIERRGMLGAMRVICVSYLTKSIVQHRYQVEPDKIDVVYNGIDAKRGQKKPRQKMGIRKGEKIVLFLGRVTMQKGPEYFIEAARKVLSKDDNVKFVIAGSGDRITQIIELAAASGIGHKVLFAGFLQGDDVERIFKMADLYVMPSVSEPFGIAPLEAISHDVPVIISKQSGVSEVLNHALKVDFWDTDEMANKILAVLRHPPLSSTLREHADMEVRELSWDGAADKCLDVYSTAIDMMPAPLN